MRVVVTGAGGFLGSHVVRGLAEACPGALILATDVAPATPEVEGYWRPVADRIAQRRLDVTDRREVEAVMDDFRPTHVVHAAAVTPSPDEEMNAPSIVVDVNIAGAFAVTDAATRSPGMRRVLIVSSAAVFGHAAECGVLVSEAALPRPITLYGISKLTAEGIGLRLGQLRGVSVAVIRLSSVYGSMERQTETRQRTSLIHQLACASPGTTVSAANIVRDWVHADDASRAMARLLRASELRHAVYHVGGGEPVGSRRIVEAFRSAGQDLAFTRGNAQISICPSDTRPILAIDRIAGEVEFAPRPIEEGIADIIEAERVKR